MDDLAQTLKPWVTFAGCVLVIAVLYWAQEVLVPIALAILLTFVLTPPVSWLERWIGRVPAVLAVVTLVFTILGLAGWGLARQMDHLAEDLLCTASTSCRKSQTCEAQEKADRSRSCRKRSKTSRPTSDNRSRLVEAGRDPSWSPPRPPQVPLRVAGSDRRSAGNSRGRGGDADLHASRTARSARPAHRAVRARAADHHDESVRRGGHTRQPPAADAVAGQPVYGIAAGIGLYFLGVPYALVWASLGAVLRFIPYAGPCSVPARPFWSAFPPWRDASALGHRFVRGRRALHQRRAGDRVVCRSDGDLAGGAAGLWRSGPGCGGRSDCSGDAADGLPRRARQVRAGAWSSSGR